MLPHNLLTYHVIAPDMTCLFLLELSALLDVGDERNFYKMLTQDRGCIIDEEIPNGVRVNGVNGPQAQRIKYIQYFAKNDSPDKLINTVPRFIHVFIVECLL